MNFTQKETCQEIHQNILIKISSCYRHIELNKMKTDRLDAKITALFALFLEKFQF